MGQNVLTLRDDQFLINDRPIYSEIPTANSSMHGLMMNARFIQGIFDDLSPNHSYARFGFDSWDSLQNTQRLIRALPEWYDHGLRAFTVGLQGGGPCFTFDLYEIINNPFSSDGTQIDPKYLERLDALIRAADEIGMVVIVSYFYCYQAHRLKDGKSVRNAVKTASNFLRDQRYTNVLIEVANEFDLFPFQKCHPLISEPQGMASLIDLAREESGGMLVGCSPSGNKIYQEVIEASDVSFIHGNSCSRQDLYNLIQQAREWGPGKPVLCNEDSAAIGQLQVASQTFSSWGYYNNMTKQEPPCDWGITEGEDLFFALRLAEMLGIPKNKLVFEDQYYLQGLEKDWEWKGQRWVRLASLYPESINYVEFFREGQLYYTAYDEPFSVHWISNWKFGSVKGSKKEEEWSAKIHLRNGEVLEKTGKAQF